tara:strand:- start:244 stop:1119 length:876 start_codon:yes stop_codon:yes gene_type:complete
MSSESFSKESDRTKVKRIALSLQYDGSEFCGWQRQPEGTSVQGVLEKAISNLDPFRPIKVIAAGRTDSGVHAAGQVAHFDCCGSIPARRWAPALNGRIPKNIRIRESVIRPKTWHACYSATYRRYRYTIYNSKIPNLFLAPWSWHRYKFRLDEQLMSSALKGLIGLHDFYAFQRLGSDRPNSFTTIQEVQIQRSGDLVAIEIQASGFLYGMVRLLVGQLVALGEHKISLNTFEQCWKERRRCDVKEAAPAHGLCLIRAGYEESIFSEPIYFDSCPHYTLSTENSPMEPPSI